MITQWDEFHNGNLETESEYYIVNGALHLKEHIGEMLMEKRERYIKNADRIHRMIRDRFRTRGATVVNQIKRRFWGFLPSCIMTSTQESVLGDGFQVITDLIDPLNSDQINDMKDRWAV